jgi:hypothetical protein
MRKVVIILSILFLMFFDFGTKTYMDDLIWHDECYRGSPSIVQDTYSGLKGYCYRDMRTRQDFYESVYKDGYSPIL